MDGAKDIIKLKMEQQIKDHSVKITEKQEIFNLGQPSSRQDAIILNEWFEKMVESAKLMDPKSKLSDGLVADLLPEDIATLS